MLWTKEKQDAFTEIQWASIMRNVESTGCGSLFCTCSNQDVAPELYIKKLKTLCFNYKFDYAEGLRRWEKFRESW